GLGEHVLVPPREVDGLWGEDGILTGRHERRCYGSCPTRMTSGWPFDQTPGPVRQVGRGEPGPPVDALELMVVDCAEPVDRTGERGGEARDGASTGAGGERRVEGRLDAVAMTDSRPARLQRPPRKSIAAEPRRLLLLSFNDPPRPRVPPMRRQHLDVALQV